MEYHSCVFPLCILVKQVYFSLQPLQIFKSFVTKIIFAAIHGVKKSKAFSIQNFKFLILREHLFPAVLIQIARIVDCERGTSIQGLLAKLRRYLFCVYLGIYSNRLVGDDVFLDSLNTVVQLLFLESTVWWQNVQLDIQL